MNTKKICLIIPSLQAGGMERVMSELAAYFCINPKTEVHIVIYGINPELFYKLPDTIIIHRPGFTYNPRRRWWYAIQALLFIRYIIRKVKPTAVLSFGERWNSFVLLALLGLTFPIYVSDRCQPDKSLGKLHDLLRKFLYPRSAGIIVQTQVAKKIYHGLFPKASIVVIGNPIRMYSSSKEEYKENYVLSVGRLISSKQHEVLIRLFLKINMPDWKLIIVGDDAIKQKNMEKLQKLICELGAEDKVELTGSRYDVDEFYRKSRIFAFTSISEGFPNVIGEAMSAGLPVVALNCIAGPSEMIVNEETGYLIPVSDLEMFEYRLKALMADIKLQQFLGNNGRKKIADFSFEIIGEQYYRTLLSSI